MACVSYTMKVSDKLIVMREIKFRAWNKLDRPDNQMYHRVNLTPDAKVVMPDGEEWELPLMQYTGLKDKNNVQIFEGDIIRKLPDEWPSKPGRDTRSLEEYLLSITKNWEVVYHTDRYVLRLQTGSYSPWSTDKEGFTYSQISGGDHGWIEVIGDIYQHPELLK